MYEKEQGANRLMVTLYHLKDDSAAMKQLAGTLNYVPEQLRQDIQALHDRLRDVAELSDQEARELISRAHRAECEENPRVYLKAIRATLIALGYDEEWVNGRAREIFEDFVK